MKKIIFLFCLILLGACQNEPSKKPSSPINNKPESDTVETIKTPPSTPISTDIEQATINKTPLQLLPQTVTLDNGNSFELQLPKGYKIYPVAEGLRRVRFFAKAPDDRLFVTGMFNLSDNNRGKVYILDGWNETTKRFDKVIVWKDKLRNPNSVQFYTDKAGKEWLYMAVTDSLVRYPYTPGEIKPTGKGEKLYSFPGEGFSYKYGGWHLTRTIAFHNDKLYVAAGSSCNLCEEKPEEISRAAVLEMNPDGSDVKVFVTGLRNAVDINWVEDKLYATNMASDHLGWEKPNDPFYILEKDKHYGWPYCYEHEGKMYAEDPAKQSENRRAKKIVKPNWDRTPVNCDEVPPAYSLFEAHGSPLGFEYFGEATQLPEIRNYFLAVLHGPTKPKPDMKIGHKIVRFKKNHPPETLIDGFFQNGKQFGRPCDIFQRNEKSFFLSDDHKGVVYLVEGS